MDKKEKYFETKTPINNYEKLVMWGFSAFFVVFLAESLGSDIEIITTIIGTIGLLIWMSYPIYVLIKLVADK